MKMNILPNLLQKSAVLLLGMLMMTGNVQAFTDDARSYAIEAAIPWLDLEKDPFSLRETWWAEDSKVKEPRIIKHQLFSRNEYWFWVACDNPDAKVSIHIYDDKGNLVDAEAFEKDHTAGVRFVPKKTGSYLIRVVIESSPDKENHWAVVYGFR